jgi:hypothetical protein
MHLVIPGARWIFLPSIERRFVMRLLEAAFAETVIDDEDDDDADSRADGDWGVAVADDDKGGEGEDSDQDKDNQDAANGGRHGDLLWSAMSPVTMSRT